MSRLKVHPNGDREWKNSLKQHHRVEGPAMEDGDGTKTWLRRGFPHRPQWIENDRWIVLTKWIERPGESIPPKIAMREDDA